MSRALALGLAGLLAGAAPVAARELVAPDAPIRHVTVFEDRAIVERELAVAGLRGSERITVEGLERHADAASLRIDPGERCRASSFAFARDDSPVELGANARARELEREADRLLERILEREARRAALDQTEALLARYADHGRRALAQRAAGLEPVDDATWSAALDFLSATDLELDADWRELDRELRELREEHDRVRGNLFRLERDRAEARGTTLSFDLTCAGAKRTSVRLGYVVGNAAWRPTYEAVLEDDGAVELVYRAEVVQRTGADWVSVPVTLATSRPALGNVVPEIAPVEARAVPVVAQKKRRLESVDEEARDDVLTSLGPTPPVDRAPDGDRAVGEPEGRPPPGGPVVSFELADPVTVTADGAARLVTLARAPLAAPLGLYAVPGLSRAAYLRVESVNPFEQTLLPGRLSILGGSGSAAQTAIETTAAGAPLELFLGADERVRVLRRSLERPRVDAAFLTGRKRVSFRYEIEATNHGADAATVTVADRMPVSEIDEVEVSLETGDDEAPLVAPRRLSDDGILEWDLELAPGETRRFAFGYRVEMPARFEWSPPDP